MSFLSRKRRVAPRFPAGPEKGQPRSGLDHVQMDWRNASVENVRTTYREPNSIHAALAMNEGSKDPDYFSGPIWAIFDRAAVERDGWNIDPPFTSPTNGFFFSADMIEDLAAKIYAGHEFQRVPLTHLAESVAKWNRLRGQGCGSGVCTWTRCTDVPDRHAAILRGHALSGLARFLRRSPDQRTGPGDRHAGRAHTRPVCWRRGKWWRQPTWSGASARPWLHRRHERHRRGSLTPLNAYLVRDPRDPRVPRVPLLGFDRSPPTECMPVQGPYG